MTEVINEPTGVDALREALDTFHQKVSEKAYEGPESWRRAHLFSVGEIRHTGPRGPRLTFDMGKDL